MKQYLPPLRKDRNRHGGGVCVYIQEHFAAKRVEALEPRDLEAICFEYQIKQQTHLVCFMYKAPNIDITDFLVGVEAILSNANGYYDMSFIGDFNCKHNQFCSSDRTTNDGRALKAYFDAHNFVQIVKEPTRYQNMSQSCIDLIFTNNIQSVKTTCTVE